MPTPTTLQDLKDNALFSLKNDFDLDNNDISNFIGEAAESATPDMYGEILELLMQEGNDLHITMPENLPEEITPITITRHNIFEAIYNHLQEYVNELEKFEDN